MPDVTSLLLAMYQQVIGGSTAREQSSLEAECARRVILSGMVIGPLGNIQISGGLTVGGNLAVTGSFSLTGLLTVGSLVVTGNATVGGTLGVTGLATLNGGLTVNGTATVNGPINAGNIAGSSLTSGTTLSVTGAATIGGTLACGPLTVSGNINGNGLIVLVGTAGQSVLSGSANGQHGLSIQNASNGSGAYAELTLSNDAVAKLLSIQVYSSTFPTVAQAFANGVALVSTGAGGLTLSAGTAFVRFMTGSTVERMRILATGEYLFNTVANLFTAQMAMIVDGVAHGQGLVMQNNNVTNALQYCLFLNSVGAGAGAITQTGAGTVAFQTTSDARLKIDRGLAIDLTALRGLEIHDFEWIADGVRDRGVFAQQALRLFPRAVRVGTDARSESGDLLEPWMTDYSKFVPDLIVGWQQHEAELTALRALLDVKRMH